MVVPVLRKEISKKHFPRSLIVLILALNFLLLTIYFSGIFFYYTTMLLFAIFAVITLIKLLRAKKTQKISPRNLIWFSMSYFKITRKYLIATIFGLLFASLVISQGLLLDTTIVNSKIDNIYSSASSTAFISLGGQVNYSPSDNPLPLIDSVNQHIEDLIKDYDFSIHNSVSIPSTRTIINSIQNNEGSEIFTNILYLTPSLITFLQPHFDLPALQSDSLLLWLPPAYNNSSITFSVRNSTYPLQRITNVTTINFSGSDLLESFPYIPIVLAATSFINVFNSEVLNYQLDYFVDIPNGIDYTTQVQNVRQLYEEIGRYSLSLQGLLYIEYSNSLSRQIYDLQSTIAGLKILFFIGSIPALILGAFFVHFSLTLVQKRKERILAILKIRGASESQLYVILLSEVLSVGVLAIAGAMLLSIPWLKLSFSSSGIFEFNAIAPAIRIPLYWYWKLPISVLILTFDLSVSNLVVLINSTIEESSVPEEKKKGFWKFILSDIFTFGIGLAVYIYLKTFKISNENMGIIFGFLLFVFSPLAVIGLLYGSASIAGKYFGAFSGKVSDLLWLRKGNILSLATRNMKKNRVSSSKLITLLIFGIILSFAALSVPYNTVQIYRNDVYYRNGSAYTAHLSSNISPEQLNKLAAIDGVTAVSNITIGRLSGSTFYERDYVFMAVNTSTFAAAAYWQSRFADQSLNSLMQALQENSHAAILPKDALPILNKNIGDNITLNGINNNSQFTINAIFNYFPNLYSYPVGDEFYSEIPILLGIDALELLPLSSDYYVYMKIAATANVEMIDTKVKAIIPDSHISNSEKEIKEYLHNDFYLLEIQIFNSLLLITLISTMIAFTFYALITITERSKEFGIFRALGMVRSQIFEVLFVESVFLLIYAVTVGIAMGYIVTDLFVLIISSGGTSFPPYSLHLPQQNLLKFFGFLVITTMVGVIVPTIKTSHQQAGSILRAE